MGGVPGVLPGGETEKCPGAAAVQLGHAPRQRARIFDPIDGLQFPLQGGERRGLRLLLVHAGGVEVAHHSRERIRRVGLAASVLFDDLAQDLLVALEHLAEGAAPLRPILRNRRAREPAAAGEPVEVVAGIDRPIESGEIDARWRRARRLDSRRSRFDRRRRRLGLAGVAVCVAACAFSGSAIRTTWETSIAASQSAGTRSASSSRTPLATPFWPGSWIARPTGGPS